MSSCRKIQPTMFAVLVVVLLKLSSFNALGNSGKRLQNHGEIHKAKNLVDALSFKLHTKFEKLKLQTNENLVQSASIQEELKMLNKLKGVLDDLVNKSSICETFYTNFDLTVAREIMIDSSVSLQKDYTVTLQVNHRELIDNNLALANGNDLRVYFRKDSDCRPRELDRSLENVTTTKTRVLFKLQEDLSKTVRDGSAYYLVYGNKNAGEAKQNPENVYLFYDDFSDSNLEKKWQKNWGTVDVKSGVLKLKTRQNQISNAQISVFAKHGYEWEDVEEELDMNEGNIGYNVAPGPFLRVQDARMKSTTAWWFEYVEKSKSCTMRPFQNNKDGSWLYQGTLTKPLSAKTWYHAKYRVVGDRFSHWFNNHIIHNNVKVSPKWMITKGTLGLGCHKSDIGCSTSYDNITVTKYVPAVSVSLGTECKVDLKKFHGLGISEKNPATSCKQIRDVLLQDGKLENGRYWIKVSADRSVPTYCDLLNGGWTLVGKVSGFVNKMHMFWLIKNYNVDALDSPALPSKVGCIDARYLATHHASTVMFASGDNKKSIGSKWVQWPLPQGRETDSLWTHSVGLNTVSKAKMNSVTVKAWNGKTQVCYQNKYGIMPYFKHGGSYPSATSYKLGYTQNGDYCMAVGVQKSGRTADGWTQNGNGYDSPRSDSDWPNSRYNHVSPYVTVWLK